MSNATQLHSHSGVALQILSRTALNTTQTNRHTVIHCSGQATCPVITAIQFTLHHITTKLTAAISEKKTLRQTHKQQTQNKTCNLTHGGRGF